MNTTFRSTHILSSITIDATPGCLSPDPNPICTCKRSYFGGAHRLWVAVTRARNQPSSTERHHRIAPGSFAPQHAHCARCRCHQRWGQSRSAARTDSWSGGQEHRQGCRRGDYLPTRRCWCEQGQGLVENVRDEYGPDVTHHANCLFLFGAYMPPPSQHRQYHTHHTLSPTSATPGQHHPQ